MKGRGRDLEADADEHQGHRQEGQRARGGATQHGGDAADVGGAGGAEDHGHAVEEESGGEGAEQEVLERRFGAGGHAPPHPGQHVSGDGGNLQGDEDQDQLDRRRHQRHAHGAEEHQGVILAAADFLEFEVVPGGEDGEGGDDGDDEVEEDAEGVYPHHAEERLALKTHLKRRGGEGGEGAEEGEHAERAAAGVLVERGLDEHDEHAEEGEDQLRQDADVVGAGNHRATTWAAVCTRGATALPAAGSIAASQNCGATPMIRAASTVGHSARRSRTTASGSAAFFGLRFSP